MTLPQCPQIWKWPQSTSAVNIQSRLWILGNLGNLGLSGSHPVIIKTRNGVTVGFQELLWDSPQPARLWDLEGTPPMELQDRYLDARNTTAWLRTSWTINVSRLLTRSPEVEWTPGLVTVSQWLHQGLRFFLPFPPSSLLG